MKVKDKNKIIEIPLIKYQFTDMIQFLNIFFKQEKNKKS